MSAAALPITDYNALSDESCEGRIRAAKAALGVAYLRGAGVPVDPVRAYAWLEMSAPAIPEARELLKDLEPTLSAGDLTHARRLIAEWENEAPGHTPRVSP